MPVFKFSEGVISGRVSPGGGGYLIDSFPRNLFISATTPEQCFNYGRSGSLGHYKENSNAG